MASPQKENGYTAIANELLEKLCQQGINGSEYRILLFTMRKTYGYQKKEDGISLSQFEKGTGIKRNNVVRATKSLVSKRILLMNKDGYITRYSLNKNHDKWVVSKRRLVSKRITGGIQKDTKSGIQKDTYKRKKENIQKKMEAKASEEVSYDFKVVRERWIEDFKKDKKKNRYLAVLIWFFDEKKLWEKFQNKEQEQIAFKRSLKSARLIAKGEYTFKQLNETLSSDILPKKELAREWQLETIIKYLTK